MHQNYEIKTNVGELIAILIDAILDDAALEKDLFRKQNKKVHFQHKCPIATEVGRHNN